jgi:hypothetical protein
VDIQVPQRGNGERFCRHHLRKAPTGPALHDEDVPHGLEFFDSGLNRSAASPDALLEKEGAPPEEGAPEEEGAPPKRKALPRRGITEDLLLGASRKASPLSRSVFGLCILIPLRAHARHRKPGLCYANAENHAARSHPGRTGDGIAGGGGA